MAKKKCICKKLKKGFINLKCPVHTGVPKIDKKHLAKLEDLGIIELEPFSHIVIEDFLKYKAK